MARRLRDLETAKLQDQNVTLAQQAQRLGSTLDAHLRFSARASSEREEVRVRLDKTEAELRICIQDRIAAEEERDAALREVKVLREKMQSIENVHKSQLMKSSEQWDLERNRLIECVADAKAETKAIKLAAEQALNHERAETQLEKSVPNTVAQSQYQRDASQAEAGTSTDGIVHAKLKECETQLQAARIMAKEAHDRAKAKQEEANMERDALELQIGNLKREISIKDKQLSHLRSQLHDTTLNGGPSSFLDLAATAGSLQPQDTSQAPSTARSSVGSANSHPSASASINDELFEILKEEKKEMREAFELKIQDLTLELEQMKRRLKDARK